METFALVAAFGMGLVSFLTSVVALLVQYAKRDENPLIAPLQAEIDALRLGQTDLIDRVDQWTKRDRTRRLRQDKLDEPQEMPSVPDSDPKQALRLRARQLGIARWAFFPASVAHWKALRPAS
jgi:hypothetical protein